MSLAKYAIRVQVPPYGPQWEETVKIIEQLPDETPAQTFVRCLEYCKLKGLNPSFTWIDDVSETP